MSQTKICNTCKEEKPISQMGKGDKKNKCKDCINRYNREYRALKKDVKTKDSIKPGEEDILNIEQYEELNKRLSRIESKLGFILEDENIDLGLSLDLIRSRGDRSNKTFKIDNELINQLDPIAQYYRLSVSDIVNVFIRKGLDKLKKEGEGNDT